MFALQHQILGLASIESVTLAMRVVQKRQRLKISSKYKSSRAMSVVFENGKLDCHSLWGVQFSAASTQYIFAASKALFRQKRCSLVPWRSVNKVMCSSNTISFCVSQSGIFFSSRRHPMCKGSTPALRLVALSTPRDQTFSGTVLPLLTHLHHMPQCEVTGAGFVCIYPFLTSCVRLRRARAHA